MVSAFVFFPPEINSALIFGGAGSAPLLVAASAWEELGAQMSDAAMAFQAMVDGLVGAPWTGPAATAMLASATSYVRWLSSAAEQATAAADQARVGAIAFESVWAAAVPTAAVAANRLRLAALTGANFLGVNTPAIAMTEFEYIEMWGQDVAAMLGYHAGATSMAAALPSLSVAPPALALDLGGEMSTAEAALVGPAQSAVAAVSALASQAPVSELSTVAELGLTPVTIMMSPIMMAAQAGLGANPAALAGASAAAPKFVDNAAPLMPLAGGAGFDGAGGAAAGLGNARVVGALSVPPAWARSAPSGVASAALSRQSGTPAGAAVAVAPAAGMPMMPMPMSGAGRGAGEALGRGGAGPNHVVKPRPCVVPRTGV